MLAHLNELHTLTYTGTMFASKDRLNNDKQKKCKIKNQTFWPMYLLE